MDLWPTLLVAAHCIGLSEGYFDDARIYSTGDNMAILTRESAAHLSSIIAAAPPERLDEIEEARIQGKRDWVTSVRALKAAGDRMEGPAWDHHSNFVIVCQDNRKILASEGIFLP